MKDVKDQSNPAAAPRAMIEVHDLVKQFGAIRAVDGVSFNVNEGEILGFLGPNGAGKTTTMRVITGYTPPTSGRVSLGGHDVARESIQARSILGYLPENAPLYIDMKVRAYLRFIGEIKRYPGRKLRQLVDEAIDECGLGAVADRLIRNLSKGYRQRVGLAQALLGDPRVLVLDEPTVGLDPRQISEIREVIRAMAGRRTVILSTHILPEVSMTCQKVVIINNGRIQAEGTPESLVSRLEGKSVILVTVDGPRAEVQERIGRLPGVAAVAVEREVAGGASVYRVEVDAGADPRAELSRALIESGHRLLEQHSTGMSLEDIFLRVITSQKQEEAV